MMGAGSRRRLAVAVATAGLLVSALGAGTAPVPPAAAAPAQGRAAVWSFDFADPELHRVGDTWYAYSTNTFALGWVNVPVMQSDALDGWTQVGDALPVLGSWAVPGYTWAPSVQRAGGQWVLYYTARHAASGRQCIGRATSALPTGPFTDSWAAPLKCQTTYGGSIDADVFIDAQGLSWLLWKNDGNCCGIYVVLWSQRLNASGTGVTGAEHRLLARDRTWEQPLVEQPAMVQDGGATWLTYSARWWESADYASGYATCSGGAGPCTKRSTTGPWFATTTTAQGPGAVDVATDPNGRTWMAHHGWVNQVGYAQGGARALFVDRLNLATPPTRSPGLAYTAADREPVAAGSVPVVLDGDGDGEDEVVWYRPGTAAELRWEGLADREWEARWPAAVSGTYRPVTGDFDGSGEEDILWYGPGPASDTLWKGTATGGFNGTSVSVPGSSYRPVAGDFDGDGFDDVLWYAPRTTGLAERSLIWWGGAFAFTPQVVGVRGSYQPAVGDFDGDGRSDVLWVGAGSGTDRIWWGRADRGFDAASLVVPLTTPPVAGDLGGDGFDDVLFPGTGGGPATLLRGAANRTLAASALPLDHEGDPVGGDWDGDGRLDLLWWTPGSTEHAADFGTSGHTVTPGPPVLP
jgi:GH43 family beta-xylosidase